MLDAFAIYIWLFNQHEGRRGYVSKIMNKREGEKYMLSDDDPCVVAFRKDHVFHTSYGSLVLIFKEIIASLKA